MNPDLIKNLKLFDLTDYEAKAYSALCTTGTASVTEVSQLCDVPRSNLYSVLERLAQKGFAETQKGRPVLFKPVPPKQILTEIRENKLGELKGAEGAIAEDIGKLSKTKADVVPALIWGVRGYSAVIGKIIEIIGRTKSEIMINTPELETLGDEMLKALQKAKERGVVTRITTEKNQDYSKYRKVGMLRVRDKIHGTDIVADEKEVLVAPSFPIVAAWVDNPEMALHVKDFLNLVWKDAQVLK